MLLVSYFEKQLWVSKSEKSLMIIKSRSFMLIDKAEDQGVLAKYNKDIDWKKMD